MERSLVKILGCNVDSFSFEQALNYIYDKHGQVVTINPEMISEANSDSKFAQLVNNSELIIADGIGVQIGLKILGQDVKRIPGIEFGKALINRCYQNGKTVALVGAKPEVITTAVSNLKSEFEGINIVYSHDGYFESNEKIYSDLVQIKPDLILVALGSPKQEYFIRELKTQLPESTMIGLGGSFDVWAGYVERAPEIYQKLGLEWLYRTIKEPKRFKRIFPTLPLFILKVFKERLFAKNVK